MSFKDDVKKAIAERKEEIIQANEMQHGLRRRERHGDDC